MAGHGEEARGGGVVISIEGGGGREVKEEEFSEEISTYVISVDGQEDQGEEGNYEIESHVKYTIVE